MKKWLLLLIPLIVIGCSPKKQEAPPESKSPVVVMKKEIQQSIDLKTAKVEKRKMISYLEVYGSISQDTENTVYVASKSKGALKSLKVAVGQTVEEKSSIATVQTSAGEEELLSPCHGIVISQYVKEGDFVDPLTSIVTIANPDVLRASFDVYEKDLGKIQLAQKVIVTTSAYPDKEFEGKVVFISPRVDENSRTIKIRVDVDNKDHLVKFGMFVNGKIERESEQEFFIVSRAAIQKMESGDTVFIVKDEETFEIRTVKIGVQTDKEAAITEGLSEGEIIVTQGSFILKSELLKSELSEE